MGNQNTWKWQNNAQSNLGDRPYNGHNNATCSSNTNRLRNPQKAQFISTTNLGNKNSENNKIPLLENGNFHLWYKKIAILLHSKGLGHHLQFNNFAEYAKNLYDNIMSLQYSTADT